MIAGVNGNAHSVEHDIYTRFGLQRIEVGIQHRYEEQLEARCIIVPDIGSAVLVFAKGRINIPGWHAHHIEEVGAVHSVGLYRHIFIQQGIAKAVEGSDVGPRIIHRVKYLADAVQGIYIGPVYRDPSNITTRPAVTGRKTDEADQE